MALTTEQTQKIWLISDTILYPEAVAFIHEIVEDEDGKPLPNSQVVGLLNIAEGPRYANVYTFVVHQRNRNWSGPRMSIKTFYTKLEKYLMNMQKQRIRNDFQLVTDKPTKNAAAVEVDELMLVLARDFIQHLIAENGVLAKAGAEANDGLMEY